MHEQTTDRLQDLIKINIDSVKGFKEAAETIDNAEIADLLRSIASHRATHIKELRGLVEMTDEEAEDSGSIKGTVHRWWLSARGTLSGGDDHAVLAEAQRGEDAIKHEYESAIEDIKDVPVREVVARQYAEVRSGNDRISTLREAKADA